MKESFKMDVKRGLSANPKSLPSKYFYDEKGDALFAQIMHLPEYYLTRAELDIFENQTSALVRALDIRQGEYFELIELGAGDGLKTKKLLKYLIEKQFDFQYLPIDISDNVLSQLENVLLSELPDLDINTRHGDYFQILHELQESHHPKVVLFLGSNIGNMMDNQAREFVQELSNNLSAGDHLLLGVDLIKGEEVVLPAYHDSQGITSEFNLNLLQRINRELNANFDLSQFEHDPHYDEKEGIARSFLRSKTDQQVYIRALNKEFSFSAGEKIATEVSRKYNDKIIEEIIADSAFRIKDKVLDSQGYFADYIIQR